MRRLAILVLVLLCMPGFVCAQLDVHPKFDGKSASGFPSWVSENIVYPIDVLERMIEGRTVIKFKVCEDGSIREVKVLAGVHPSLDEEIVRVVSSSPKWTPAMSNGKPEDVVYVMPVYFKDMRNSMSPATFNGGGKAEFKKWVLASIKLPHEIKKKKISGEMLVSFTITEKGVVKNPTIVKGVHPLLDEEVLRVVSSSPGWVPAENNGTPIMVTCSLPLHFSW